VVADCCAGGAAKVVESPMKRVRTTNSPYFVAELDLSLPFIVPPE
jgi:hypothetical protein